MSGRRTILGVYGPGSSHWVGDGFPVRNLFPSNGVSAQVNPFLLFDYAGPAEFAPADRPRGVGEHPHRGFETVTIAYQGGVDHRDSAGNAGSIRPGGVQWMTAGSGVVHEEKHSREFTASGGAFEMVQLWVNLPRAHKMTAPGYQAILNEQIPVADLGGGCYGRVIAGRLDGVEGPARTFTPLNLFDLRLREGRRVEVRLPAGHTAGVALLRGGVAVNGAQTVEGEAQLVVFSRDAESVELEARRESTLLLMSGEPIAEPVASYGPFVMNTPEEIREAIEDYRAGRMGRLE